MSMTTPRVTVPVEAVELLKRHMPMLEAAASPAKSEVFVVCGHEAREMHDAIAHLSAAPAPEGGAVKDWDAIRSHPCYDEHQPGCDCAALATRSDDKPEGGAVKGPGGYLVKDFADGWYWTPNAALDHAGGAPVWSVDDSRYETDPPAISAQQESV